MINNRRHIMYVYKPVINTSNNKSVIRMFERDIEISQKKIVHLEIGNPLIRMPASTSSSTSPASRVSKKHIHVSSLGECSSGLP